MHDAIVLAGGAARRLGGADKPGLEIGAATLLDRVLTATGNPGALVVVGPPRPLTRDVIWAREDPPGGGPVAAIAAGLAHTAAEVVLVLAADLPFVAPAVPALLDALARGSGGAAALVDANGRLNHLATAWRRTALADALAAIGAPANAAARSLLARTPHELVADPAGWGRDCDTWDDVEAARHTATHHRETTSG